MWVHVYFDRRAGVPPYSVVAAQGYGDRGAAVRAACGNVSPYHGFTILSTQYPPNMFDGFAHPVYAYGIDVPPQGYSGPPMNAQLIPLGGITVGPCRVPSPPTNPATACLPGSRARLSWSAPASPPSSPAAAYLLSVADTTNPAANQACAPPGGGTAVLCNTTVPGTSYTYDFSANPNDNFDWRVYSCGSLSCAPGTYSTTFAQGSITLCKPLDPPANLTASCYTPTTTQARIAWNDVTNALMYKVIVNGGAPILVPPGGTPRPHYDFNYTAATPYNFSVAACQDALCIYPGNPASGALTNGCAQPCGTACLNYLESNQSHLAFFCNAQTPPVICPPNFYTPLTCNGLDLGGGPPNPNCDVKPYGNSCNAGSCTALCSCQAPGKPTITSPPSCNPGSGNVRLAWGPPASGPAPVAYEIHIDNKANGWNNCNNNYFGDFCFTRPVSPTFYDFNMTYGLDYDWSVASCATNNCSPSPLPGAFTNGALFNCPWPLASGSPTEISGHVYKAETAPATDGLTGIIVELRDAQGALRQSIRTASDGGYRFSALQSGTYHVNVAVNRNQSVSPGMKVANPGDDVPFRLRGLPAKIRVTGTPGTFVLVASTITYPGQGYAGANPPSINQTAAGSPPRVYSAVIGLNREVDILVRRGAYRLVCWNPPPSGQTNYSRSPSVGGKPIGGTSSTSPPALLEPQTPGTADPRATAVCP